MPDKETSKTLFVVIAKSFDLLDINTGEEYQKPFVFAIFTSRKKAECCISETVMKDQEQDIEFGYKIEEFTLDPKL